MLGNKANRDGLRGLLEQARREGCGPALNSLEDAQYFTDVSRALYLDLLPFRPESQVLEIGASFGHHTQLIAEKSKRVVSLEIAPEKALFAKLYCEEKDIKNVGISVGGSQCTLPYASATFDIVIMNHVLEWCAARSNMNPATGQKLILQECQRVLKPGGVLFLSTKNRFCLRLVCGMIDDHVGFRFGNALPRWLMRVVQKVKAQPEIAGYLHSYGQLRKMLRESGFGRITAKLALPDARFPKVYCGLSRREIVELRCNLELLRSGRLTKLLVTKCPLGLIKWITPSLVYIAEK